MELKPDAAAGPDELLQFLTEKIAERPALPKEIILTETMPLTAVGKIFKPSLRWDQTRKVFLDTLKPLMDRGLKIEVEVGEDKKYGTLARVRVSDPGNIDRPPWKRK